MVAIVGQTTDLRTEKERHQMEIGPGIYQLKMPLSNDFLDHVNCYLVEGKDGWLMVDTGWCTPGAFDFMEKELKALGLSLRDISTILVTHVHPDHFGLAGKIKQASPGTRLLTHCWEAELIESRYIEYDALQAEMGHMMQCHGVPSADIVALKSASMPFLKLVAVVPPDRTLYGGEIVSTGTYDLEVVWTPGHSPGHICLYEPQNQFFFSGDHVLPSISPNVSYHVHSGGNPLGDYLYALRKIQNLPVARVLPAHGRVFTDLRGRVQEIVSHHNQRKSDIRKIIRSEARNACDISGRLSWNVPGMDWDQFPPLQKRLAFMETLAHLEDMRWQGEVTRLVGNNGSVSYLAV